MIDKTCRGGKYVVIRYNSLPAAKIRIVFIKREVLLCRGYYLSDTSGKYENWGVEKSRRVLLPASGQLKWMNSQQILWQSSGHCKA